MSSKIISGWIPRLQSRFLRVHPWLNFLPSLDFFPRAPLPPFTRRHPKPFFEHRVEQAEMTVAAVEGDVDDLGVRLRQQLPRPLQPQLNLPRPQRHTKLLPEQPAEMTLTAMQLPRQLPPLASRQLRLQHVPHHL